MNLIQSSTPNKWLGGNRCEVIIVHWWDKPSKKPTLGGTVAWFQSSASQVSAHYVVSDQTVYQMCPEIDRAWHAMQANDFAIGIEVDPNTPGQTYETLGELVRQIRTRWGNLPLKRHRDYVQTDCPGTIDLAKIEQYSKGVQDMAEKITLESGRRLFYYVLGYDGIRQKPNALAGEVDAEINARHVGKDLTAAYIRSLAESQAAKDAEKTLGGKEQEVQAYRKLLAKPDEARDKLNKIKEIVQS